jgi:Tol biopolymer transport system component
MTFARTFAACVAGLGGFVLTGSRQESPARAAIAFASHRDGNWEIYLADADGQAQTRITSRNGHTRFPLW